MSNASARKSWNVGSPEAALRAARVSTEEAIESGCPRCPMCHGEARLDEVTICPQCGGAGFLVPPGGMPAWRPR